MGECNWFINCPPHRKIVIYSAGQNLPTKKQKLVSLGSIHLDVLWKVAALRKIQKTREIYLICHHPDIKPQSLLKRNDKTEKKNEPSSLLVLEFL